MKKKYYCYWNLHKKCYSVKYGGRVIFHARELLLRGVEFKVSEAGRQRVLKEKKKNVHAFVAAEQIIRDGFTKPWSCMQVKYNPYKNEKFVLVDKDGQIGQIYKSETVSLTIEDGKPVMMAV